MYFQVNPRNTHSFTNHNTPTMRIGIFQTPKFRTLLVALPISYNLIVVYAQVSPCDYLSQLTSHSKVPVSLVLGYGHYSAKEYFKCVFMCQWMHAYVWGVFVCEMCTVNDINSQL